MLSVTTPDEVRKLSGEWKADGFTVGLVPTMGALHAGHISLVEEASRGCDRVVASLFVNPAQFARGEDLDKYPRDLEGDKKLLEAAGCDALFSPTTGTMYGESGTDLTSGERAYVEVGELGEMWEGVDRPGHFRGVATVVSMLFNAVVPHRAYFGEKDFQQLRVIQKMVKDLLLGVEVIGLPTIREPDGLALSSRNVYLSSEERSAATVLNRALLAGAELAANGESDATLITSEMRRMCESEPRVEVKYLAVVDTHTLKRIEHLTEEPEKPARTIVATRVGRTRLIDNMEIAFSPGA